MNSRQTNPSGEFLTWRGTESVTNLLCLIASSKLRQLGYEVAREEVLSMILGAKKTHIPKGEVGGGHMVTCFIGGQGRDEFVLQAGRDWRVHVFHQSEEDGGTVCVFSRGDDVEGRVRWLGQNTPTSGAAHTTVLASDDGEFSYVGRESHLFEGLMWDPTPEQAADVAYYQNGGVRWEHSYQNGAANSSKGRRAVFRGYWKNGAVRTEEYGDAERGIWRSIKDGEAYSEYYPNGEVAVKIFVEKDELGTIQPTWKTEFYRQGGRVSTRKALLKLKELGGGFDDDEVREIEDSGSCRDEELGFLENFCRKLGSSSRGDAVPFFIRTIEIDDGLKDKQLILPRPARVGGSSFREPVRMR